MEYNLSFDMAAMILAAGLLIYYISRRCVMTARYKTFGILLSVSFFSVVLGIVTKAINSKGYSSFIAYPVNIIYYISLCMMPYIYYIYFLLHVNGIKRWSRFEKILVFFPVIPVIALIVTTPWNRLIFEYTPSKGYICGGYNYLIYIHALIYMLASFVFSLIYRKRFSTSRRNIILLYSTGSVGSIVFQYLYPEFPVVHYASAVVLLLAYMSTANLSDDEDSRYGVFNKEAFIKRMTYITEKGESCTILGINAKGGQMIRERLGVWNYRVFMRKVLDRIRNIAKGTELYLLSDNQYVILSKLSEEQNEALEYYIWKEFRDPVEYDGNEIVFDISMFCIECPKEASMVDDIIDILEMSVREQFDNGNGRAEHAGKQLLEKKRRENLVFQAMRKAIYNKSFKVYYQPIYNVNKKYFQSAEALIRLIDDELGYISPEEFIPIAERMGLILEIGDIVFEQVCRDISVNDFSGYGIDYVEVNLSTVQCMQSNIEEHLSDIMKKYSIRPDQIDLEITETAMAVSGDMIHNNMTKLSESGCTFAMDDFGTGFSNLSAIIQYPFNIVKLDKSIIWSAMEDPRAMSILNYSVSMLKELSFNIVAEGIETIEQADKIAVMGCDYFQGFYFSKPVSVNEFLTIIENTNSRIIRQ